MDSNADAAGKKRLEDFNPLDPIQADDPYEWYSQLHAECPVYRVPQTGMFFVTKYDDLRALLRDNETFSNNLSVIGAMQGDKQDGGRDVYGEVLRERGWEHMMTLQRTDPPLHRRYREVVEAAFTASRVRTMVPRIEELTHQLIDTWIDDGECEFIEQFSLPLPGTIIAEQVGLPATEIKTFKRWATAMMKPQIMKLNEEEMRECAEVELEVQHYLDGIFKDRRANPQSDLISVMVNSRFEGQDPLSDRELQSVLRQLINGGYETVITALAHAMWQLIRFPELQDKLRADKSLIKNFVEESLRWESPVVGLFRRATKDTEFKGVKIPKDSIILAGYAPANRDESKFACPHQFDVNRENAGAHLAFGSATHFCPGGQLARQEMNGAISILLDRIKDIELARPLPVPAHHSDISHLALKELYIKFKKIS